MMRGATNTLCEPSPVIGRIRNNAATPTPQIGVWSGLKGLWLHYQFFQFAYPDLSALNDYTEIYNLAEWDDLQLTTHGAINTLANGTGPFPAYSENAVQFDGFSYISRADEAALRLPAAGVFTFAVWIKRTGTSALAQYVFAKQNDTALEYSLTCLAGTGSYRIAWTVTDGTRQFQVVFPGSLARNVWHLVLVSYNRAREEVSISVNAGPQARTSVFGIVAPQSGANFTIGKNGGTTPYFFTGQLHNLARWNRLLNNAEKATLFTTHLVLIGQASSTFFAASGAPPADYPAPAVIPAAPSNLSVDTISGLCLLEWINNSVNAIWIEIWRSTDGAAYEKIYSATAYREGSYLDLTADPETQSLAYKIRAGNFAGLSAYSSEVFSAGGDALLTEAGDNLLTEDGKALLTETAATDPVFTGLVHYWPLNEAAGASRVDTVGGIGAVELAGGVARGDGLRGYAADFRSDPNKYLGTGNPSPTLPYSLAFWCNVHTLPPAAPPTAEFILSRSIETAGLVVWLAGTGNLRVSLNDIGAVIIAIGALDTWHFVAITADAAGVFNVSIDGAAFTSDIHDNVNNNTSGYRFGKSVTDEAFDGLLDSVMVWNRQLSLAEVQTLYNSGSGLFPS